MKLVSTLRYQLALSLLILLISITPTVHAVENKLDYQLQSSVYAWYGQLDIAQQKNNKNGAHHLLSITPLGEKDGLTEVEVELEYLPKKNEGTESTEITGHYQIQKILINPITAQVNNTEMVLDEVDDFTSRYRSSSDSNLIRAFIYRWSQLLDNTSIGQSANSKLWQQLFAVKAIFTPEESQINSLTEYLSNLSSLKMKSSRHEIKNLSIRAQELENHYNIDFEYQWKIINQYGENELAQLGVEIEVEIKNGQVIIHLYKAKYLPPVTDLGAEIRC
ncbi:MAG: hypothetical protein HAW66_08750 [Shewanella sp.]|nr:hypothetical protein [Shewanella sp.]